VPPSQLVGQQLLDFQCVDDKSHLFPDDIHNSVELHGALDRLDEAAFLVQADNSECDQVK
jgi:acyl carrier protein phosphodiesterase